MNCMRTHKVLALYVGGDLPLAQMQQVSRHLATCADCREEEVAWLACRQELQSLAVPASDASPSLWAELESRLDVVDAVNRHQRRKVLSPRVWSSLIAAGALLSLPLWWKDQAPLGAPPDAMVVATETSIDSPAGLVPVPDRVLKEFLMRNSALMGHSPFGLSADVVQPASLQEKDL